MDQWYEVFDKATGEVVSIGTVIADPLPTHLDKRAIPAPTEPTPDPNKPILAKIERLENSQRRAEREYFLTGDKTALQNLDAKINELRVQLK